MRRFWAGPRSERARDRAGEPRVRYVYDRPLPYARILRVEFLGPDGAVESSMTRMYHPRRGWISESVADCA